MSKEKNFLSNLFGGKSKNGCCNMEIIEEAEDNCCSENEEPQNNASCCSCDCNSEKSK